MTDAFMCDFCETFHECDPYAELYQRVVTPKGTDYTKAADVCAACLENLDLDLGTDDEEYMKHGDDTEADA
jgi:hypothetical protein